MVGKTISETPLVRLREARIIDVVRDGARLETPLNELRFEAGDTLLLETPVAGVKGIKEMPGVVFQPEAELGGREQRAARSDPDGGNYREPLRRLSARRCGNSISASATAF